MKLKNFKIGIPSILVPKFVPVVYWNPILRAKQTFI